MINYIYHLQADSRIDPEDKLVSSPSNNDPYSLSGKSAEDHSSDENNDPSSVQLLGVSEISNSEPDHSALQVNKILNM